jgi:LysM repeat protein
MATVIQFPSAPRPVSARTPGPVSVRPLPIFAAVAVVVLFFAAVHTMQHGVAAEAAGASSVEPPPSVLHLGGGVTAQDSASGSADVVVVEVARGDTLWSIASELQPGRDPRPLVAAMIEANGGSTVQIGQEIVIPVRLLGEATALR